MDAFNPLNKDDMTQQTFHDILVPPLNAVEAGTARTIQEKFEKFHAINPTVFNLLVALARQMKSRGRRKIGIGMLYEVLRWNYYQSTDDPNSDYKLCNNYRSRYARKMMAEHHELQDFITFRELRTL